MDWAEEKEQKEVVERQQKQLKQDSQIHQDYIESSLKKCSSESRSSELINLNQFARKYGHPDQIVEKKYTQFNVEMLTFVQKKEYDELIETFEKEKLRVLDAEKQLQRLKQQQKQEQRKYNEHKHVTTYFALLEQHRQASKKNNEIKASLKKLQNLQQNQDNLKQMQRLKEERDQAEKQESKLKEWKDQYKQLYHMAKKAYESQKNEINEEQKRPYKIIKKFQTVKQQFESNLNKFKQVAKRKLARVRQNKWKHGGSCK